MANIFTPTQYLIPFLSGFSVGLSLDFKTWIKVKQSGQIGSAADYIGIETGPRKTHLFNTHDFAVSLRWVFAVQHRIY